MVNAHRHCKADVRRWLQLVAAAVLATSVVAADGPLQFTATTAGREVTGALTALGSKWSATIGATAIPAGQLVELHQVGQARPPMPVNRPHLLFVNGDRWPGSVAAVNGNRVRFLPEFGIKQEVLIPLSAVSVLWLSAPRNGDEPNPLGGARTSTKRPLDEVRLSNRDTLSGTLVSVDQANVTLDDSGRPVTAPRDRVVAITLTSELAKAATPRGPFAHTVLTSGARVTMTDASVQDGRLVGKSTFGATVRVLLGDVVSLSIRNGPAVLLGELEPTQYEHTPYLGTRVPYAINRSTASMPLRVGTETFDRGIGLHSQSRLTYHLPTGANRFESWLGLDSVASRSGQVVVSVLVNDTSRFGPAEVAGGQPPRRIVIPLSPTDKTLTLVVDFGQGGNVQDDVNWGDARFIVPPRESSKPPPPRGVK